MPLKLYQGAGHDTVELSFYLNGKKVEKRVFNETGVFEVELSKTDDLKNERYLSLQIKASSSVIPKDYGTSEDERELSWMVKEISQR